MIVENQKNLKVHFAGAEVMNRFEALKELGIKYSLYTAFPFLERAVLKTKKFPIMKGHLTSDFDIPKYVIDNSKHVIQDSGLFTLMFGSHKGDKTERIMDSWYNELVNFTLEHNKGAAVVEVDCQKVLGVKKAWEYRKLMKNDLPNHRQINVFHKEDGQKGLDELIEFSDYIAISVPELRAIGQKKYVNTIAHYIKNKKPSIDIHLLGCTEKKILNELSFCTSADSTSYFAGNRFGYIKGKHINRIKTEEILKICTKEQYDRIRKMNNELNTNVIILSIYFCNKEYNEYAGIQD